VPALVVLGAGGDHSLIRDGDHAAARHRGGVAQVRLLGVNDLHGTLESPGALRRGRDGKVVPVGGAAVLGSYLNKADKGPDRTIRLHAGDMVGASPLISSHFHDEPSVQAMNLMRFDVGTVGNHEFDEGASEMLRLLRGGRRRGSSALKRDASGRPVNTSSPHFKGVDFPYIAANTVDRGGGLLLPPYKVIERDGVRVGFIGVTTSTTPTYLLPRFARRLRFPDISDTVNRYVPVLQRKGVEAIVVLAHSGAFQAHGSKFARGEVIDEAKQMSDAVDVVVAGHTHSHLNVRVGNKLVVEAFSFGTAYDKVDMAVDRRTGDVVSKSASVPRTWADEVKPEPRIAALVRHYARLVAPLASRQLGRAPHEVDRLGPGHGGDERGLGRLAADAQRALAHADIAFVNPGNMRDDLGRGPVTYRDLFDIQRYEHPVLRMRLRGADVRAVLDQQFERGDPVRLHASGLSYKKNGDAVDGVVLDDGRPLDPSATYTVAANELIATSDRFTALRDRGRGKAPVGTDLEALTRYVERLRGPVL
jgi:5'-nucleotidase